jgi:hypothetical protein
MRFVTYTNRSNRHVAIHVAGCSQIRKRGGEHERDDGEYHDHETYDQAKQYAQQTGVTPVKDCHFCKPSAQQQG